jgi:hypothetical protein
MARGTQTLPSHFILSLERFEELMILPEECEAQKHAARLNNASSVLYVAANVV